ncbi:MAG: sugar kinase [Alphaproteobacteria bacterium]|nr:MAG: sugar kinase [Alphaproteobacteria bacterium]
MATIARSDDLRRQNQRRVLAALRRLGPMSRTELSVATGLSASTVTTITAGLLDSGAVAEAPASDGVLSRRGRPQVTLSLNPAAACVGAVSLSLNRISAAIVDYSGQVAAEIVRRVATRACDEDELAAAMVQALQSAHAGADAALGPLRHIAVGVQGVTDSAGTAMLWSPITTGANLPLARRFEAAFHVPVTVANDCKLIARALRWRQPDQFGDSFAAVLLSHGIGMGLFVNGSLVGGIGSSATEFGHMTFEPDGALCRCGRRGCIEAYAGDYAIWRAAHDLDASSQPVEDLDMATMARVADRARRREGPERQAYRTAGRAIGAGLRSMFALFDPFPVAFVGSGAAAFDLLERTIRETIGESAIGMATSEVAMRCFADEFPLVRDGATWSALSYLDDHVFVAPPLPASASSERSLGHAL